jgi:hypothetical protein
LQRLVPLQQCGLHHVNHGKSLSGLGALVQECIPHGPQLVLQPAIVCPQGLHEGVEGVVLLVKL